MEAGALGEKQNMETLLSAGKTIQIYPKGYSMWPFLRPGCDAAVIAPADAEKLKRGDVVLYRRPQGILVLHRIVRRRGNDFFLAGDSQEEIEGPLSGAQIRGKLVAIVRDGKRISVKNPRYLLPARLWLCLLPFRGAIRRLYRRVHR